MYCPECGAKLSDTANFCNNCGKEINQHSPAVTEDLLEPKEETAKPAPTAPRGETAHERQILLSQMVGKNADYYAQAFARVENGEKTKFMWSAFFFSSWFLLYRNCLPLLLKYFLPPIITMFLAYIGLMLSLQSFSLGLMAVTGAIMGSANIWLLVNTIMMALKFPARYYEYLNRLIDGGQLLSPETPAQTKEVYLKKYAGTTWIKPLALALCMAILMLGMVKSATTMGMQATEDYEEDVWLGETVEPVTGSINSSSKQDTVLSVQPSTDPMNNQALKETQYFIQPTELAREGYEPSLALYSDGEFVYFMNHSSDMGEE